MSRPTSEFLPRMRGATGSVAGRRGLVPKPAAADNVKYLKGDGSWSALSNASAATDAEAAAGTSTTTFLTPANAALAVARVRNALAARGGIAFDGTTSTRATATLTNQNIGTDPFAVSMVVEVPTSVSADQGLVNLSSHATVPANAANAFYVELKVAGNLVAYVQGASTSDTNSASVANVVSTYGGKRIVLTFVRPSSGSLAVYINGVAQSPSYGTTGTPITWQGSITSTYLGIGYQNASQLWKTVIYSAVLYNLALTQADVTEIMELGGAVPERFRFGSQAAITSGSLTIGKAYRITAAGGTFTGVGSADNSIGTTFVATGTTPTWSTGAVVRAGAVVHYDADSNGIGYQLHDQSTNKLHALLTTTGVSWTKAATMGYVKVLSDGTTSAQALGGGTILPANCQIIRVRARSISGTPSITLGSSSGGSQYVASVALSTTWKDLTIALTGGINTAAASLWMTASAANVVEVQLAYEQLPA